MTGLNPTYYTASQYSVQKLKYNLPDNDFGSIYGCAGATSYSQYVILMKTTVDSQDQSVGEFEAYYLYHPDISKNPGTKCRGMHVSDRNDTVLVLFSATAKYLSRYINGFFYA